MNTILTKDTCQLISGFSIPKIETVEDMNAFSTYLLKKEHELGIPEYQYKVIPWIESALGISRLIDILTSHRNRI